MDSRFIILGRAPSQEIMDSSGSEPIDYDFVIPIQPSKIAKLAENRNWHIAVQIEKNNHYPSATFAYGGEYGITWYGEIAIDSPGAFVWPLNNSGATELNPVNNVLAGTDFNGSTNQTSLMIRYISNGNYQQTIQSSGMEWLANIGDPLNNGDPYRAQLVTRDPVNPQEMAIKFSYSGVSTFSSAMPYLDSGFTVLKEKNSYTSSPEEGDLYDYNLWVSLSDVFQNATYRGTVSIGIRDPFYIIMNATTGVRYAGTTFAQLSQSFNSVQDAANQAVIETTSGQTIKLLREINANLFIPVGSINGITNYDVDRDIFILDFDKHRINGNITISGVGSIASQVYLSGLGIINGTLTIDGRNINVVSDAEVIGNTFIYDTDLTGYEITERHHSPIIVGENSQGRARIVSSVRAADTDVVIETIERVFFEGEFDRITFNEDSTTFDFDGHARFDNAMVSEIEVAENAEIYIANGSSVTSGFITPTGRTARIYLESGATIAGTITQTGNGVVSRLYSSFTGNGTYDLTEFENNVVNLTRQVSYVNLQAAINMAAPGDRLRVREMTVNNTETIRVEVSGLTIEGIQRDYSPLERYETLNKSPRYRNRAESVFTGDFDIESSGVEINGLAFDFTSGKNLLIENDDVRLDYVWVTKDHAMSGIEAAVEVDSVQNLVINESAFTDIADYTVQNFSKNNLNYRRHAILLSGVLSGITIHNSDFREVDGKNIGVTGASVTDIVIADNDHRRSIYGNYDEDAIMHFNVVSFTSGLIHDIDVNQPNIEVVRVNTTTTNALVENVTIEGVNVTGIIQRNHITLRNSASDVVYSGYIFKTTC
jgi:hypothetical protein